MATTGQMLDIAEGKGTPQGPPPPSEEAPTSEGTSLGGQWQEFLNQPGNAAAMVQFGIKAMQPIAPGQSIMGHLGNAVGAAGEAKQKVTQTRLDNELKQSQVDLARGRADYYQSGRGFTAYQQASQAYRENAEIRKQMDDLILLGDYGVMNAAELSQSDPEAFTQLYNSIAQSNNFQTNAPSVPSLGGAVKQYPVGTVLRNSATGQTSTLTESGWVTN